MIAGWPTSLASGLPRVRASASTLEPGVLGTIILTGTPDPWTSRLERGYGPGHRLWASRFLPVENCSLDASAGKILRALQDNCRISVAEGVKSDAAPPF
jgi:hypothetical protein